MNIEPHHINYFNRAEFERNGENWFEKCSPRLLVLLDTFRHLTGECIISPHPLAIGRRAYDKNPNSQHSVDTWREVRAIDLLPTLYPDSNILPDAIPDEWIQVAKEIGFTGIGLYPQWTHKGKQRCGLHLDVRDAPLATWGYIDGKMVSIETALETL